MRWISLIALATALVVAGVMAGVMVAGPAGAATPSPIGRWLTADRTGVIEIAPCGGALCGRIVGMTDWPDNGDVPRDLHGRPQCGLTIITQAVPHGANRWDAEITNPDDGHTYSAEIWTDPRNNLHLRGYVGIPLFGATQIWTPYAGTVPADCRVG